MDRNEQFRILLLDDDLIVSTAVSKALRSAIPEAMVITARSIAEGQVLASEFSIHFFILDVNLPDGSGIDFLCDLRTTFPDARVVVITGMARPEHQQQLAGLSVLQYCEKPVDVKRLAHLVCQVRDQLLLPPAKSGNDTQFFAASLSRLSSLDIVQLKCLTCVTQAIEFRAGQSSGRIYFDKGEIIHAETGSDHGEAALVKILSWRGGKVVEVVDAPKPARSIWSNWQALLLQAAQFMDESTTQTTSSS